MDEDQEQIANAAAYYIIVSGEFLKNYLSKNEDEARTSKKKEDTGWTLFIKVEKGIDL